MTSAGICGISFQFPVSFVASLVFHITRVSDIRQADDLWRSHCTYRIIKPALEAPVLDSLLRAFNNNTWCQK